MGKNRLVAVLSSMNPFNFDKYLAADKLSGAVYHHLAAVWRRKIPYRLSPVKPGLTSFT